MTRALHITALLTLCICGLFYAQNSLASELKPEFRFNNTNWFTSLHPVVSTFSVADDGTANGTTTTNTPFSLKNIPNKIGMRIQRFEIQEHFHYIIAGNVVYTLPEISAQLADAYNQE